MGQQFFNRTMPDLVTQLKRIADALTPKSQGQSLTNLDSTDLHNINEGLMILQDMDISSSALEKITETRVKINTLLRKEIANAKEES